jgi:hypothetical protein
MKKQLLLLGRFRFIKMLLNSILYDCRRHLILSCQGSLNIFPFDDPLCSFALESSKLRIFRNLISERKRFIDIRAQVPIKIFFHSFLFMFSFLWKICHHLRLEERRGHSSKESFANNPKCISYSEPNNCLRDQRKLERLVHKSLSAKPIKQSLFRHEECYLFKLTLKRHISNDLKIKTIKFNFLLNHIRHFWFLSLKFILSFQCRQMK